MKTIIERPVISEKSLMQASTGWYTFAVSKLARKEDISKEIAASYKVDVIDILTRSMHGKEHRAGRKMTKIRKPDWKKAMVRLKPGQHIDAFEVTSQQPVESKKVEKIEDKKVSKEEKKSKK